MNNEDPGDDQQPVDLQENSQDEDDYAPGSIAYVTATGYAQDYNQYFVLFLEYDPVTSNPSLNHVLGLASESKSVLNYVDLSQNPIYVKKDMLEETEELPPAMEKDTQNFIQRCESPLRKRESLKRCWEALRDGDLRAVKDEIRLNLENDVYPGSPIDLSVDIASYDPDEDTDEDPDESEPEERSQIDDEDIDGEIGPRIVKVAPVLDPMSGVRLDKLVAGDRFTVRIVGPDARELKRKFLETERSDPNVQSRPFQVTLSKTEPSKGGRTIQFIVQLTQEIFGRGRVESHSRVSVESRSEPPLVVTLRRNVLLGLFGLLLFLFSASLLVLIFPDVFLTVFLGTLTF